MIAFLIDADNFSAPAWIDEAFQTIERNEGSISIRRAYGSGGPGSNGTVNRLKDFFSSGSCIPCRAQRPELATSDGLRHRERVAPKKVDVFMAKWRQPCLVDRQHTVAFLA